jgi:hypothetical protein
MVNVRISPRVCTFAIVALLILALMQATQVGDWPMKGHDAAEVVEPQLDHNRKNTFGEENIE